MAVIHDVMPEYEVYQPADIEGAIELLHEHGDEARVLAGGMDTWDWLKDRAKRITALVDLSGIEGLRDIRVGQDGIEIGAMAPLAVVASHPEIRQRFTVLSEASARVASPQIRNQGTLGGNISQDTRCHYYRGGWPCYRAGGNTCYANTATSLNREHAILGADRCVAINPSDSAPALVALDAVMVVRGRRGEREIEATSYFIGPGTNIRKMNVLKEGEILTTIRVPNPAPGTRFYFEKVTDRQSWDFPLMNVASALRVEDGVIRDSRIVIGGAAAKPLRLYRVEKLIAGRAPDEATGAEAGELAIRGAEPLRMNAFKIPLMRNLVKRAIRGTES